MKWKLGCIALGFSGLGASQSPCSQLSMSTQILEDFEDDKRKLDVVLDIRHWFPAAVAA